MFRPALRSRQPPVQWVLGFYPGVKWPGRDVGHSSPSTAEVKGEWSYASTSPKHAIMAWTGATLQFLHYYFLLGLLFNVNKTWSGIAQFLLQNPKHTTIRHTVFLAVLRALKHAFSHERIRYNSQQFILQTNARAAAQSVSCRPLPLEAHCKFQASPCGIYGKGSGTATGFLSAFRFSP